MKSFIKKNVLHLVTISLLTVTLIFSIINLSLAVEIAKRPLQEEIKIEIEMSDKTQDEVNTDLEDDEPVDETPVVEEEILNVSMGITDVMYIHDNRIETQPNIFSSTNYYSGIVRKDGSYQVLNTIDGLDMYVMVTNYRVGVERKYVLIEISEEEYNKIDARLSIDSDGLLNIDFAELKDYNENIYRGIKFIVENTNN